MTSWAAVMVMTVYFGDEGNDLIHGNNGSDTLYGGIGNDILYGGTYWDPFDGDDVLYGGYGYDELYGGAGNDDLFGGHGNDRLVGGAGNDELFGEYAQDYLLGGAGNDLLVGGKGNDTLQGYHPGNSSGFDNLDILTGDDLSSLPGQTVLGDGADNFVLGNSAEAYHLGNSFATITDFNGAEGDTITVHGNFNDYSFGSSNSGGGTQADTFIYYHNDLIGIVHDTNNLSVINGLTFV